MSLEDQIRTRRALQKAQIAESLGMSSAGYFTKGSAAQEGEERTHGGVKVRKVGNKWVPVSEGKEKKEEDLKSKSPKKDNEGGDKKPKSQSGESQVSKKEIAELTAMKNMLQSNPDKAMEIFESLSPEAQNAVPQDVVNELVENSYSEAADAAADVFTEEDSDREDYKAEKESLASHNAKEKAKKEDREADVMDYALAYNNEFPGTSFEDAREFGELEVEADNKVKNSGKSKRKSVISQAKDITKNLEAKAVELEGMLKKVNGRIKAINKQAGSRKLMDEKYELEELQKQINKQLSTPISELKANTSEVKKALDVLGIGSL